ncbi:MAG: amino acid ABC transporter ATP-binding protein [Oscillospiraceae bacterium]
MSEIMLEKQSDTAQTETVVEVSHITKGFGDNIILNDLSLSVKKGEVVVVIGPSGCGKSTLLRCLNGLEPIQSGTVTLHGKPVEYGKKTLTAIRQKIGMVFQSYDLFPHMNVLANVMLAPLKVQKRDKAELTEEALALLDRVGLKDKAEAFPSELSGGQKQRVAIVRSLIIHPDIILLDEITAALDPEMVHEVLNVVLDLAKNGTTMMIVTHEMAFAEAVADRVIFLDGGTIVEEGVPSEFFHNPKTERAQRFLKTFTYTK